MNSMQEYIERTITEASSLDKLAESLAFLLNGNFSIWTDGTLLETRARVATIDGVTISINPRDHAPPHFHIKAGETNATLCISDGSLLKGFVLPRHDKLIHRWFQLSKPKLVTIWNETRPTDCPVGRIIE